MSGKRFPRRTTLLAGLSAALIPLAVTAQTAGYEQYQYDSLGRLILRWDNTGRQEGFTFDPAENRSQVQVTTGGAVPPAPVPPAPPVLPSFLPLRIPQRTIVLPWRLGP